jgi:type II pantothenate kinase
MNETRVGIDAGATLIKIAYVQDTEIHYQKFSSDKMEDATQWINDTLTNPQICITGGKSKVFESKLHKTVQTIVEFIATCEGINYLIQKNNYDVGNKYIVTNVGTGTSIHYLENNNTYKRVGGIGLGGGTLVGLSFLLTGIKEYDDIVKMSLNGNRNLIDLKVRDIYTASEPPISGDLTASNFGNINNLINAENMNSSDLIASITGMIGESVTTISCQAANRFGTSSIIYIGSTFLSNSLFKETINDYTLLRGEQPFFIKDGEYSGAIGALLSLRKNL